MNALAEAVKEERGLEGPPTVKFTEAVKKLPVWRDSLRPGACGLLLQALTLHAVRQVEMVKVLKKNDAKKAQKKASELEGKLETLLASTKNQSQRVSLTNCRTVINSVSNQVDGEIRELGFVTALESAKAHTLDEVAGFGI